MLFVLFWLCLWHGTRSVDICVIQICLNLSDLSSLMFSGSHSANLSLLPNGCRAWAWKTLFQLQTPASAQNIFGPNASGTITGNSFWEKMLYPPYCPTKQPRCAFRLYVSKLSHHVILSHYVIDESVNIAQIELRKRGVVPKETNMANKTVTQAEQDRAKEAGVIRRDKRSTVRVSFLFWTQ